MPARPPVAAVPEELMPHLGDVEGVEVVPYDHQDEQVVPGGGRDVDVLALSMIAGPWLKRMDEVPGLRAVVLASAGYEHALPFLPEEVQLANAVGVHDTATSELGLALVLAAQRHLPHHVLRQHEARWDRSVPGPWRSLADSRVLVVGYGGIGTALTRRLLACECEVVAVASTARAGDDLVDQVHGVDELPDLLGTADVVVLTLPLTDRTRGLIGGDELAALPDQALVVNIARGPVVDTDALLRECGSGRLRAALDVTDPEPLPDGHPLFTTPGVLVVPHVGGASPASLPRMGSYLRFQLEAYRDAGELAHQVGS
ncbi:D-3-phosphoglycerate dehydrogenase [Serinicoccus hydrothermalis]|uniref:D-3-phosphoglycerate dehydrogenase n=1 Tax=Serinicoccus hydrothermalis TaxID=1758689 RepID=A0A1B1NB15_9MICO|nr:NAD(P)-dependent oxidoreductase [Serinicoccus hydrothermalis]ANS78594.1 D-3-phosphoglycerate dehydrogenase [Serinicoccus hydrothermalis]